jgi:two-component system, chemotaxis family, CheB/CheR fusion protein
MQSEKRSEDSVQKFPIVGVGASAGGLEAFTQLLEELPLDTGMAFVLVQHLAPSHESALPELLARATKMPVLQVTDEMAVEPNHLYVIPPNTNLAIEKQILKLEPRERSGGSRSIDFFFESLAEDCQECAIAVILSGTASDGTKGAEAIKGEGGIVFAQDESAKYDSMPRSAIAAGCVDFVISPAKIARELAWLAKQDYLIKPIGDHPSSPKKGHAAKPKSSFQEAHTGAETNGFAEILSLLQDHFGIDFSLYKPNTLQRRILRRTVLNRLETLSEYAALLQKEPKELDALYADVLIGVTSFFRNPEAFELMKTKIFPQLLQRKHEDPLRVWVPGCSSGQEPFSIAIAYAEFAEKLVNAPKMQIFATDISERQLNKGQTGLFSKSLVNDVSEDRLQRFFVEENGGYRLVKRMRESVIFARHNLFGDPPFSRLDLISCRNLLIYFEPELQQKVLPLFHYALNPDGLLFLGAAESIGSYLELFEPIDKKWKFFVRKPATTPALHLRFYPGAKTPDPRRPASSPLPRSSGGGAAPELTAQREAERVTINRFAPPGVLIDDSLQILQFRGETQAFLQPPIGKASFDLLKMARKGLMVPLRTAVEAAKKSRKTVRTEEVLFEQENETTTLAIEVIPLQNVKEPFFLVFFVEERESNCEEAGRKKAAPKGKGRSRGRSLQTDEQSQRIVSLEHEVTEARAYVQSIQEQYDVSSDELQTSNEEVQSANEELQSINEELETSKEELESTNEELTTVNEEMVSRNRELHRVNNDLLNLQTSVHTAIVLLGSDLAIRRFSPLAEKTFNLTPSDIGRSIGRIKLEFDCPDLEGWVREIIDTATVQHREVRDEEGRWFSLRGRPYKTTENEIDGAVLMLIDIDDLKRTQNELEATHHYADAIVDQVAPLLVLDTSLRVVRANESFLRHFKVSPKETEGRLIYDLGNGQWDIPELRNVLEKILPEKSVLKQFEVEHNFETLGPRILLLDATQLDHIQNILLSIDDVTAQRRAERSLQELNQTLEQRVAERTAEIEKRVEQLQRVSFDLVDTEHRERRRLAVILHDDLQQILVAAQMHASHAFGSKATPEQGSFVLSLISQAIETTRLLAKELAPPILYERGLGAGLEWLARWAMERYHINMEVQAEPEAEPADLPVRILLFEGVRELLLNVAKHAGTDQVRVSLDRLENDHLRLRVEDFGRGFDAAALRDTTKEQGLGLFSLQERIDLMSGQVEIESAPGRGTRVQITLPLDQELMKLAGTE